jgi:hypothetical protein
MDVTKAPPPTDLTSLGVGTAPNAAAASQSNVAADASTASSASTAVTAVADRVDIQPLDVAAALQILIAEVRAELPLPGANLPGGVAAPPSTDVTANPPPLSQPAGLAPLGSQAMPLNPSTPVELPEPPTLEPLPAAPDLAAAILRSAAPVILGETVGGAATRVGGAVGAGAEARGTEPPLPSPSFVVPLPEWAPPPQTPPGMGPPWMAPPSAGSPGSSNGEVGGGMAPEPSTGGAVSPPTPAGIPAGLDLGPLEPLLMPPGARLAMPSVLTLLSSPAQASPVLMRMFLQAVPQEAGNAAAWSVTVNQLEGTLRSALDRAVATVEQWHDVPQVVVDAARETRGLVLTQLDEEPPGPLWLRPEWMWLSPQMERFRRRRRLARRSFRDPDFWPLREDNSRREEPAERKGDPAGRKEEF